MVDWVISSRKYVTFNLMNHLGLGKVQFYENLNENVISLDYPHRLQLYLHYLQNNI